jgi:outer membrane phospholipase A
MADRRGGSPIAAAVAFALGAAFAASPALAAEEHGGDDQAAPGSSAPSGPVGTAIELAPAAPMAAADPPPPDPPPGDPPPVKPSADPPSPVTKPPIDPSPAAPPRPGSPIPPPGCTPAGAAAKALPGNQAGAGPQRTMSVRELEPQPARFWLFNDNYFAWQPNSEGRTRVKFQVSVRYDMLTFLPGGTSLSLNIGYTQKSFWDLFAFSRSSPFVETNYKPELFFSFRPWADDRTKEFSIGVQHESNGLGVDTVADQSKLSRGWNSLYVDARWGFDLWRVNGIGAYLALGGRGFVWPFVVAPDDMTKYVGWVAGTVDLALFLPQHPGAGLLALRAIVHTHSVETSAYYPLGWLSPKHLQLSIYAQVFSGDAERLIAYKDGVTNYYLGLGFR